MPDFMASRSKVAAIDSGIPPSTDRRRCCASLAEPIASDLVALDGAFLENKGPSLVVHFRGASVEDGARAEAVLLRHARPHLVASALRTMRGAFMLELMPNIEWHKGCAVNWIRDHVVKQSRRRMVASTSATI